VLRKILPSDYKDMYEYSSLDEVTKYLLWSSHPSEEYTRQYIEYLQQRYKIGDFYDWAISLKDSGKMIGTCGFTRFDFANNCAEIGYVLNPKYWGQGYCTEAVSKIIEFGFNNLHLNRIEARYMKDNVGSRRVMEKCKMTFEGTMKSAVYAKNKYWDIGVCAILKDRYF
jgi:ribosomal-protein-alanine N-acetyltransferase